MPSFNKVILAGNTTRDPQLKHLPGGSCVAEFGLAINRKWTTQAGEQKEDVCFVDCAAFGKQAETITQYVQKGKPLLIEGRLKFDSWEDKQSGAKRSKLTVNVDSFQFLGGRDENDSPAPAAPAPQQRQQSRPAPQRAGRGPDGPASRAPSQPFGDEMQFKDDSIPF